MSRRSTRRQTNRRDDGLLGVPRPLTRKQVQDMLRRKQSFSSRDLRGVDLSGISFDGADMRDAKLAEANLYRCSFRGADLRGASMWQANLQDAVLDDANLEETDLDMANLDGTSFQSARIRKAIFPHQKIMLPQIEESVRSGRKIAMPSTMVRDEDD